MARAGVPEIRRAARARSGVSAFAGGRSAGDQARVRTRPDESDPAPGGSLFKRVGQFSVGAHSRSRSTRIGTRATRSPPLRAVLRTAWSDPEAFRAERQRLGFLARSASPFAPPLAPVSSRRCLGLRQPRETSFSCKTHPCVRRGSDTVDGRRSALAYRRSDAGHPCCREDEVVLLDRGAGRKPERTGGVWGVQGFDH